MEQRLGVDGLCSDFPERVREAIDKFQSDTGVVSSGDRPPLLVLRNAQAPPSSRDAVPVVADGRRGSLALEWSEQDGRLLRKAYGDLALVWEVSARVLREADLAFRACRFASAVTRVLSSGDEGWSAVKAELMGTVELHREVADAIGRWALPTRRSPGEVSGSDGPGPVDRVTRSVKEIDNVSSPAWLMIAAFACPIGCCSRIGSRSSGPCIRSPMRICQVMRRSLIHQRLEVKTAQALRDSKENQDRILEHENPFRD